MADPELLYHLIREDDVNTFVQIMDEHNISPNMIVSDNDPILMVALGLGYILDNSEFQPRISELLVGRGADVNIMDGEGNTPLVLAARRLDYDVVRFLLRHGADPNIKSADGYTPYQVAILALEEKQYELNIINENTNDNTNMEFKEHERQRLRDGMKILKLLTPISEKNVGTRRLALEPSMRNIVGALTVRGVKGKHIPRNVVWGPIRKYLTTKTRRRQRKGRPNTRRAHK